MFIPINRPALVQQGAAGIAWIDGSRLQLLDDAFNRSAIGGLDGTAQGTDNAHGHCLIEAKRIAQRVSDLPNLQVVRRADEDGVKFIAGRVDPKHGNIPVRIGPDPGGRRRWNDRTA